MHVCWIVSFAARAWQTVADGFASRNRLHLRRERWRRCLACWGGERGCVDGLFPGWFGASGFHSRRITPAALQAPRFPDIILGRFIPGRNARRCMAKVTKMITSTW
jgi:hypothetical protein